jgi:signal transduction histidine kinase
LLDAGPPVSRPTPPLGALLLLAAAFGPAADASHPAPVDRPYRVVVIQGIDPLMPAPASRLQGLRRALTSHAPGIVDVTTESVDHSRFGGPDLDEAFLALMRAKYDRAPVDVIVAVGAFGLDFAVRHRAELWSDAPIVYHALDADTLPRPLPPRVTGIATRPNGTDTLALARRLQPEARHVAIVSGTGAGEDARARRTSEAVRRQKPPLDVVRVSGTLDEVKRALAALPRDTIVMFDGMSRDASGATFFPSDVVSVLSAVSPAPLYGHLESSLGRGIVGGALVDAGEQGRLLGELVVELLAGRVAPDAPMRAGASPVCTVDARQLARFGIPRDRVPDGCTLAFHEAGLIATHPWLVSSAIALILLQAVLIGALLIQWRQRRDASSETQRMRSELAHAARLATVGELTAAISHEINQPLGAVQSSADAAEMLLEGSAPRLDRVREILANIRAANHRASEVVRRLRTLLQKHEAARQPFDLNDTVDDVLRMVDSELRRRRIVVDWRAQRPLGVEGDPVQIQQVVLNLIMNAMDAIGDAPIDRRRIRVRLATDGEGMAVIQVADRGDGIPDANLPHLFESFFTTKPHGMGLGLSVSHSIVKAHGGRIQARNNSHGGATFVVALPLGVQPAEAGPRIAA